MKSYWIWNYGDYEIYHSNLVHSRREQCGVALPPMWRIFDVDRSVIFYTLRDIQSDGMLTLHLKGIGHLKIDDKVYASECPIAVTAGKHKFEIHVMNLTGLPAAYIESNVVSTDGEWYSIGPEMAHIPVGFSESYDSADSDPQVFPFSLELCRPVSSEQISGGILFDFENELFGYLNISGVSVSDRIHVSYGESREEAIDTEYSVIREDISGKNSYRLRLRAFRYIFITGCEHPDISAEFEFIPVDCKGSFHCDDESVNRIWDMCSYTLRLNMREVMTEGIKRDRWLWSGDAYQSFKFIKYLTAESDTVRRSLIALRGKDPVVEHVNNIVDYSFYWVIALNEYYNNYGDADFIKIIYARIVSLMDFCRGREDEHGFVVEKFADWAFVDWSEIDKEGAVCAIQMLYVAACRAMSELTDLVGHDGSCYSEKADKLCRDIVDYFWDEELGAFIDSFQSGRRNVTRHANIFAVLFGIADERQTKLIIDNVLMNESITKITTPYFEGYELDAMGQIGRRDYIYDMITSYWKGMLDLGATTVWEEFDPNMSGTEHYDMYGGKYMKSLCHAWGASPIYLLGKYYLGVRGTSPGYKTFEVEPYLGQFGYIEGTVPVRDGTVSVHLDGHELCVSTDVEGGTVIFSGKRYELSPGNQLYINF